MRVAALAAVLALTACGGGDGAQATSSPSPADREHLRQAFRASFLHSCLGAIPGKAGSTYCHCTDQRLEATFSGEELAGMTADDPKFRAATHACAAKAGLRVAPGH